jgi:hypothetical protein
MKKRTKKRVGRPRGRRAPHRPTLSTRVPQELYDSIKEAAREANRTMGQEVVRRVQESFGTAVGHSEARAVSEIKRTVDRVFAKLKPEDSK